METNKHTDLKLRLYKKIRCPECGSENKLEYKRSNSITCQQCKTKYPVIDGVPVLFSKESAKLFSPQFQSASGQKMVEEYSGKTTLVKRIKNLFTIPHLGFDILDRKKFHSIVTHKENPNYIILNIGGGPKREDKNVLNLNIDTFPNVEIVGDAHNLPFKSNSLDGVMIIAVLEHLHNPSKAVEEIYRVLKKGGYVYAETPFLQHFHGYPNHYQNFTLVGHDYLFRNFKKIESGPNTGPFSTVAILTLNIYEDLFSNKFVRKIMMIIVSTLLFPFKYLDILSKKNKSVYKLTNGVYFLGQKS